MRGLPCPPAPGSSRNVPIPRGRQDDRGLEPPVRGELAAEGSPDLHWSHAASRGTVNWWRSTFARREGRQMCSGIIIAHPTQSVPAIPEPLDRFVGAAGGLPHLIAIRLVCATATAGAPRSAQAGSASRGRSRAT